MQTANNGNEVKTHVLPRESSVVKNKNCPDDQKKKKSCIMDNEGRRRGLSMDKVKTNEKSKKIEEFEGNTSPRQCGCRDREGIGPAKDGRGVSRLAARPTPITQPRTSTWAVAVVGVLGIPLQSPLRNPAPLIEERKAARVGVTPEGRAVTRLREVEERVVMEDASDDKDEVEIARVDPLLDIGFMVFIVVVRSIVEGAGGAGLDPPTEFIVASDRVGEAGNINKVWWGVAEPTKLVDVDGGGYNCACLRNQFIRLSGLPRRELELEIEED